MLFSSAPCAARTRALGELMMGAIDGRAQFVMSSFLAFDAASFPSQHHTAV